MWSIASKALTHLGLVLLVDVFFHYLYILTIPSDMKLVTKLSDWCLGGLDAGFCAQKHPQAPGLTLRLRLCSRPGLLQPGVRLGESSRHVRGGQHRGHAGPPGPSSASQVHHRALRLRRDVRAPPWPNVRRSGVARRVDRWVCRFRHFDRGINDWLCK